MDTPFKPWWFLQQQVDALVRRWAQELPVTAIVDHDDDAIVWDGECEGFGRVSWDVRMSCPPEHPARALLPMIKAEIATLQARYDLGVTSDRPSRKRAVAW
jgi:hypothetical protein